LTNIAQMKAPLDSPIMSVWETLASLSDYAFETDHSEFLRRRREWFTPMIEAHAALWWIPENHGPSLEEAKIRLDHLRMFGSTPEAFTFKNPYPAPRPSV
jgi:Domain of unknown function (DUF3291)